MEQESIRQKIIRLDKSAAMHRKKRVVRVSMMFFSPFYAPTDVPMSGSKVKDSICCFYRQMPIVSVKVACVCGDCGIAILILRASV